MGNCTGYCNSCGDEATQVKTLDQSQIKHSIKDKDFGQINDDFQNRYNNASKFQDGNGGQFAGNMGQ